MLASISRALSFLREALQRTSGLRLAGVCTSNSLCCIESDFATLGYDTLESRSWNKRASIQFHLQTEVSQWALSVEAV